MKTSLLTFTLLIGPLAVLQADTAIVNELLQSYQNSGAGIADKKRGYELWNSRFESDTSPVIRSCTSCHTANLRDPGKHSRTGKTIAPLAPSVNPKSLTDIKKIKKWLKRNCKWTLGRECSVQEKTDLLSYIQQQ